MFYDPQALAPVAKDDNDAYAVKAVSSPIICPDDPASYGGLFTLQPFLGLGWLILITFLAAVACMRGRMAHGLDSSTTAMHQVG